MSEANSPYFAQGCADAARDNELMDSCPAMDPEGMNPELEWSVMYRRGYNAVFVPGIPHQCDQFCRAGG